MRELTFAVAGTPAQQGSKTAVVINGVPRLIEGASTKARKALKTWRDAVAMAARAAASVKGCEPFTGPMSVDLDFWLALPATDPYRHRHATTPDLDKLIRAVLDALTISAVISDDSRVCSITATKLYAREGRVPGVDVTIRDLSVYEADDREESKRRAREGSAGRGVS